MRKPVQVLLILCLIGTCVAVVGAVLRTSDLQEREELGVFIHRSGMGLMLIGFVGLFLLRNHNLNRGKQSAFSWVDLNGKLTVSPAAKEEILNISRQPAEQESMPNSGPLKLEGVRWLIARGAKIDRELVSQLVEVQHLRVLDLQDAILDEGVAQELELLESLEVILLAGCLDPSQAKDLRNSLPDVRMIFEPR